LATNKNQEHTAIVRPDIFKLNLVDMDRNHTDFGCMEAALRVRSSADFMRDTKNPSSP
jgi:hypothetical protein